MAKILKRTLSFMLVVLMLFSSISLVFAEGTGINLSKTANGLTDNFLADVNLQVGGDSFMDPVDIVFVIGAGVASDSDTIKQAVALFESLLVKDIPVKLGIASLEAAERIVLDLNTPEADLRQYYANGTLASFIKETCDSIMKTMHPGTTNLDRGLNTAWEMLKKDDTVKDENKFVFTISTGRTYWFDNEDGLESTVIAKAVDAKGVTHYLWADYLWRSMRSGTGSSTYVIPQKYNNSFSAYWKDAVNLITNVDGDKYVYTPEGQSNELWFSDWSSASKNGSHYYVGTQRQGLEIDTPAPSGVNFATGVVDGVPYESYKGAKIEHAMNYERAQYEAWLTYTAMDEKYNMFAICSESAGYQNNSTYNSIGHSYMDFLAGGKAPLTSEKNFFQPIADQIKKTHLLAEGSYVKDYMGYNDGTNGEDPYNFDFVDEANTLALYVGSDKYTATKIETTAGATSTYSFKDGKFILDYYYDGGAEDEHFKWTFNEIVSSDVPVSLDYKVKLVLKPTSPGIHDLDTNRVATLFPVDSEGVAGTPKDFPVPSVKYEVSPYDVDIVLALGAGMAQYDADAKYNNTYNSIVSLVKPLIEKGINVKLGLVAVEHYDDVAMPLTVLTKENYETVITEGLDVIQKMPAGPTNLHSNIEAAQKMLDDDKAVPDANKFFYVFATGRTYNFDNEDGVPSTIINKVSLKGNTYYYWGHYLWQSQRGGHTSLYMIPAKYNNDFNAYWKDVCAWVEADGNKFVYSFTDAYDVTNDQWFNTFYNANNKDAKALKLASSRFGWILGDLTNSGLAAIGSGSNPGNALNYERAQYEAYKTYVEMASKYNCYALCTESPAYLNESLYITLGAGYKGTSTIQLGHSFMDHLAKVDGQDSATVLFKYIFNDAGTPISTDFTTDNYFKGMEIDVSKLVKTAKAETKLPMFSTGPKKPAIEITSQPTDVEVAIGEKFAITVEASGEGLTYQWYYMNKNGSEFAPSSFKGKSYAMTMAEYCNGRQVYCVITDANGKTVTTDIATITRPAIALEIVDQPKDVEVAIGEKVAITVGAVGDGLTYQWYYKNASDKEFALSSYKSKSYTITMAEYCNGRQVYCVVTDKDGNTVTTDVATMSRPAIALEIVDQPKDVEVAIGEKVAITVGAVGEGLTYQWYYKNASDKEFAPSSYKSKSYTITMAEYCNGRQVYCVVTDKDGNTVTTDVVTMSRPALELTLNSELADVTVASGVAAKVTVDATGDGLKYQWFYKNKNGSSFAVSSIKSKTYSVSMSNSCDQRQVYCVITDAYGNQITTNVATLYKAN